MLHSIYEETKGEEKKDIKIIFLYTTLAITSRVYSIYLFPTFLMDLAMTILLN